MNSQQAPAGSKGIRQLRILWINPRLLHPLNGGDRIRTYNMLKELKKRHHVTYVCLQSPVDPPEAVTRATEFCHEVVPIPHNYTPGHSPAFYAKVLWNTFFGIHPSIAAKYRSPATVAKLRSLLAENRFDVVVCDYLVPMINLLALGQKPQIPLIIFQHNVESLIWKRHVENARNPLKRLVFQREWKMTHQFEETCASFVDGQITVSDDEEKYFRETRGMNNVLGAVPTGVDFEFYQPGNRAEPHTMAFLGSMDWHANMDSVRYFAAEIYPGIKKRFPDTRFLVIGRNPPVDIQALGTADPSIEVTGTVPDVRPYLERASLMILPLRVGGGTRIKVFEAMAMGLAVVSTHVGAEGLPVTDGENIVFADTAAEFTERVCELFASPDRSKRIGNSGLELVRKRFGWSAAVDAFEQHCYKLLNR